MMKSGIHIAVFFSIAVWGAIELQFAKTFGVGVTAAIILFVGLIGMLVSLVIWLVLHMHIPVGLLHYWHK